MFLYFLKRKVNELIKWRHHYYIISGEQTANLVVHSLSSMFGGEATPEAIMRLSVTDYEVSKQSAASPNGL